MRLTEKQRRDGVWDYLIGLNKEIESHSFVVFQPHALHCVACEKKDTDLNQFNLEGKLY